MPAADLAERQAWWIVTVLLAAVAVYLIVIRGEIWAKIIGLVLVAAPHLYGAPQPDDLASNVPAVLASEYAVASLVTNMFFWAVLGLALGWAAVLVLTAIYPALPAAPPAWAVAAAGIDDLMEDAATAEISRSQVWQWVFNGARLDTGEVVTRELVERVVAEEHAAPRTSSSAPERAQRPGRRLSCTTRAGSPTGRNSTAHSTATSLSSSRSAAEE